MLFDLLDVARVGGLKTGLEPSRIFSMASEARSPLADGIPDEDVLGNGNLAFDSASEPNISPPFVTISDTG